MSAQVVQVKASNKNLTYLWMGEEPLEVGDWVRIPPNWYKKNPQVLQVVQIGSDYTGAMTHLTEKIECTCDTPGEVLCYYHPDHKPEPKLPPF